MLPLPKKKKLKIIDKINLGRNYSYTTISDPLIEIANLNRDKNQFVYIFLAVAYLFLTGLYLYSYGGGGAIRCNLFIWVAIGKLPKIFRALKSDVSNSFRDISCIS